MPGKVVKLDGSKYADGEPRHRARWHSVFARVGERKYVYKIVRKESDAKRWIALMDREDAEARNAPPSSAGEAITFAEMVQTWRETRLAALAPRTQARYEQVLRTYLVPAWGTMSLADITREQAKRYFNGLARSTVKQTGKPMTPGTLKKIVTVASSVFSEALDLGYVAASPVARLKAAKSIEQSADPAEALDPFTEDEIDAIAGAIPAYRVAILTAGHAGPRASELWALRVRDIDLENPKGPRIHIRRAIKRGDGQGSPADAAMFGPPKNGRPRSVRIPTWLADELCANLATLPDQNPDRLVFDAPEGGVVRHSLFMARRFRPALRELDIRPRPFHQLRHSFASMLIRDGASDLQVQEALGHSDARSTAIYSHLWEGHDDELLARRDAGRAAKVPA